MLRRYHHATSIAAADTDGVVVGEWRGGVSSSWCSRCSSS